jgi:hypothetical protein
VWVIGADESVTGPYTADGVFGDGEFWTDVVLGDSITVVFEPAPADTSGVIPFRIEELSHRFRKSSAVKAGERPAAASCALDVTCRPEYAEPASAVALMIFESGGKSYECSGALISSAAQPAVPFS